MRAELILKAAHTLPQFPVVLLCVLPKAKFVSVRVFEIRKQPSGL